MRGRRKKETLSAHRWEHTNMQSRGPSSCLGKGLASLTVPHQDHLIEVTSLQVPAEFPFLILPTSWEPPTTSPICPGTGANNGRQDQHTEAEASLDPLKVGLRHTLPSWQPQTSDPPKPYLFTGYLHLVSYLYCLIPGFYHRFTPSLPPCRV